MFGICLIFWAFGNAQDYPSWPQLLGRDCLYTDLVGQNTLVMLIRDPLEAFHILFTSLYIYFDIFD